MSGSDVVGPCSIGEIGSDHEAELVEIARDHRRVGHYFEKLVGFWLREIRGVEIVALGEQVREERRTIGELDCVFRDEDGVLTHWELAVKFFLHHPSADAASEFPGPNATDNFERKIARLFDHQLPLSAVARPDVECRQALVRGCIFRHYRSPSEYALPERMAADHEQGWWLRAGELDDSWLFDASTAAARIMAKPHWLGLPADLDEAGEVRADLTRHFEGRGHPLMVAVDRGGQLQRVVVVDDHWPATD